MEINEGASSANNAYMKPLSRSSLLSRPAPMLQDTAKNETAEKDTQEAKTEPFVGKVKYTPNEPEEENAAPQEEAMAFLWGAAAQKTTGDGEKPEPEIAPDQPWEGSLSFPAYEETAEAEQAATEPEFTAQSGEELTREEAAYMEYWQQWHAAMAAQQNIATCSVCPLLKQTGSRKGRVCLVPVIIPEEDEEQPEPEAILTMIQREKQEPEVQQTPAEEPQPLSDFLKEDEEDFSGEDIMPNDQMPQPQTVPQEMPELGIKKSKKLGWLWALLAVVLLAGGIYAAGRMGWLRNFLMSLHLPQAAEDFLIKLGML